MKIAHYTVSKGLKRTVIILFAVWILVMVYALTFSSAARQRRNLAAAQKYVDKIGPQITNLPAFNMTKMSTYTASDGCLMVHGRVDTEKDFQTLTNLIHLTHPPTLVIYEIILSRTEDIEFKKAIQEAPSRW